MCKANKNWQLEPQKKSHNLTSVDYLLSFCVCVPPHALRNLEVLWWQSEMLNNYEGQKYQTTQRRSVFCFLLFFHCHIWFLVDAFTLGSNLNLSKSIILLFVLVSLDHSQGKIILKSYWKNVNCIEVWGLGP